MPESLTGGVGRPGPYPALSYSSYTFHVDHLPQLPEFLPIIRPPVIPFARTCNSPFRQFQSDFFTLFLNTRRQPAQGRIKRRQDKGWNDLTYPLKELPTTLFSRTTPTVKLIKPGQTSGRTLRSGEVGPHFSSCNLATLPLKPAWLPALRLVASSKTRRDLQPTCNQLATNLQPDLQPT